MMSRMTRRTFSILPSEILSKVLLAAVSRVLSMALATTLAVACCFLAQARTAWAEPGVVLAEQKISASAGGFSGSLDGDDYFGASAAALGDFNGDGIGDVAAGAPLDDDGPGDDAGAVWLMDLDELGNVIDEHKISAASGGFGGSLAAGDEFGRALAAVGDLDGDGITELAVGAPRDDDGEGDDSGAVWILFLASDGTVRDQQKISDTTGGFSGRLNAGDLFGFSIAALGDLDGDEIPDIAVGAPNDDDGTGNDLGAVWIVFLDATGKARDRQKLSKDAGGFGGGLDAGDAFGTSVALLGDIDLDAMPEIAVGTPLNDDGSGTDTGAVWIVTLQSDGRAAREQKISNKAGGLASKIDTGDLFGWAVAGPGDLDGDGVGDLVTSAPLDDDGGGVDKGALWVLFLEPDGTVAAEQKISAKQGGFDGQLAEGDAFGTSIAVVGDLDGDAVTDLIVGAPFDNDGPGVNAGALWTLFLDGVPQTCTDADRNGRGGSTTDALVTLNAVVGAVACEACRCDVDGSGAITASDALRILNLAVGLATPTACPRCMP